MFVPILHPMLDVQFSLFNVFPFNPFTHPIHPIHPFIQRSHPSRSEFIPGEVNDTTIHYPIDFIPALLTPHVRFQEDPNHSLYYLRFFTHSTKTSHAKMNNTRWREMRLGSENKR